MIKLGKVVYLKVDIKIPQIWLELGKDFKVVREMAKI